MKSMKLRCKVLLFQLLFYIIGSLIFASIINYWIVVGVVPLTFLSVILRKYYIGVSRDIKRLEGTSRTLKSQMNP